MFKYRLKARTLVVVCALLFLTLVLQACSSIGSLVGEYPEGAVRATWTPVAHPTDQPFAVEVETYSYFGGTPLVVIFGSNDPEDDSPLQAINLATEDVYDVSTLTPGPISTWSRPILAEDKALFFQMGSRLHKLLPGGAVSAIDLPFDEEDSVFCNWSWKGQVVCLNDLMTQGYLVDQSLSVMEITLPAYASSDDSVEFYPPVRAGENGIRILQTQANKVGGRFVVKYRELDLSTLSISDEQIPLNFDFNHITSFNDSLGRVFEISQENIEVLGLSEDGKSIFLQYYVANWDDLGNYVDGYLLGHVYNEDDETPVMFDNRAYPNRGGVWFSGNYLITRWEYFQVYSAFWPRVYSLETGEEVFNALDAFDDRVLFTRILPYGENWLVGSYYGLAFFNEFGIYMETTYFPDEMIEAYSGDGLYVVSQPMEP